MKLISLYLPKRLLEVIDKQVELEKYPNRSEAIRSALYKAFTYKEENKRLAKYYQCIGCKSQYKGEYLDIQGYDFCPNCGLELKGWSGK